MHQKKLEMVVFPGLKLQLLQLLLSLLKYKISLVSLFEFGTGHITNVDEFDNTKSIGSLKIG